MVSRPRRPTTRTAASPRRRSAAKTTTSTYDADDRLLTQTDADGNLLTNTYDAFGNLTEAKHQNSAGTTCSKTSRRPSTRWVARPCKPTRERPVPQLDLSGQLLPPAPRRRSTTTPRRSPAWPSIATPVTWRPAEWRRSLRVTVTPLGDRLDQRPRHGRSLDQCHDSAERPDGGHAEPQLRQRRPAGKPGGRRLCQCRQLHLRLHDRTGNRREPAALAGSHDHR